MRREVARILEKTDKGTLIEINLKCDSYVGYVEEWSREVVWISQNKSLVSPLFFSGNEILRVSILRL